MKVLHILPSLDRSGAESIFVRLVGSTIDTVEHEVISLQGEGELHDELVAQGIKVTCLNMPKGKISVSGFLLLRKILKECNKRGFIVQTWMYHSDLLGGITARLVGIKAVYWGIRNTKLDSSAKTTRIVFKLCALLSKHVPKGAISCSYAAMKYHRENGYKCKFDVVPNGYPEPEIEDKNTKNSVLKDEFQLENCTVAACIARWDPIKDHRTLLEALAIVKKTDSLDSFKIVLIGRGCDSTNSDLVSLVKRNELENNVIYAGQLDNVSRLMSEVNFTILSSKSEAFPNVLAESMLVGTPCVSTLVGDAKKIVGDLGWLAEPENADDLASKIKQAILFTKENSESLATRKRRCVEHISNEYSVAKMSHGFLSIWSA